MTTELEQFKKWHEQTKRYIQLIKGVDKLKEQLKKMGKYKVS